MIGHHDARPVAQRLQVAGQLVGTGAGFHADQATRQLCHEFEQRAAADGLAQHGQSVLPWASTPCTLKTFLASSIPTVVICPMTASFEVMCRIDTPTFAQPAAARGAAVHIIR